MAKVREAGEASVKQKNKPNTPGPTAGSRQMTIQKAVTVAGNLFGQGKLDEAESICRQIIESRPKTADAHNILGVILHRKGQQEDAVKYVRNAVKLNKTAPNYFSNLGEIERVRGNLDGAVVALKQAVKLDDKSSQAWNNLGIVYYDRRNFPKAVESYRKAIEVQDNYAEAHNNLGNALRAMRKPDEAINEYECAIEIRENYPEAYNNMGTVFRDTARLEQAEASFRRAIAFRKNYLEAMNNLGGVYLAQRRYDEALRILGDALKEHPGNAQTLLSIARAQNARGAYPLANRAVQTVLKENDKNVEALILAGQVSHELDRYDAALEFLEKALELQPKNIEALNYYGVALKSVGRLEDSRKAFIQALEAQPRAIGTYSNLVDLEKFSEDNPLFQAMARIASRLKNPKDVRYLALHFALGKAYDDIGNYEKAFEHYSLGASLKRPSLKFDEAEAHSFFGDIINTFSEKYFADNTFEGSPSKSPIFIVGMPRSGSTLAEQIISAHPKVFGAGEIKTLSYCVGAIRQKYPSLSKFPALAKVIKPSQLNAIARNYLSATNKLSNSAPRVTDKLLTNFFFAGLIHVMFPNAKIIHTKRNPVDSCLSTFTKLFKDDMPHSYDLGELGRYYVKYQELMAHWKAVLPSSAYTEIQYEELVADPEPHARRLIEFCDLEWDPQCLSFHESKRPVKTASVSQVRKPIYTSSVERWRRYGPQLNPLLKALGMETLPENA